MGRKKTFLIPPHLVDCGGDLTKQWYVEYSCRNPNTDQMKRFREYGGFTKLRTAMERYDHADRLINEIRGKLASGWTPYDTVKRVSYEDELGMQKYAERWGKMRESVPSLRMYLSGFLQLKKETVIPHSYQTYRSKLRIFNEWAEHEGLARGLLYAGAHPGVLPLHCEGERPERPFGEEVQANPARLLRLSYQPEADNGKSGVRCAENGQEDG